MKFFCVFWTASLHAPAYVQIKLQGGAPEPRSLAASEIGLGSLLVSPKPNFLHAFRWYLYLVNVILKPKYSFKISIQHIMLIYYCTY